MGPSCEVLLINDDGATLEAIDAILSARSNRIDRTRKGRVWDIWIRGHPVHIRIDRSVVALSAGLNSHEDASILRELAESIVHTVGGMHSEPEK